MSDQLDYLMGADGFEDIEKHTPGPWRAEIDKLEEMCSDDIYEEWGFAPPKERVWSVYADGSFVAMCGRHEQTEANAHLIARAPDLLAENTAMRAVVEAAEGVGKYFGTSHHLSCPARVGGLCECGIFELRLSLEKYAEDNREGDKK